jgi:NTE family protein
METLKQKTLALALGGGSALGFAHVGFLQILEEAGIKVHAISGASMGALVGAFYAYGYDSKQLEEFAVEKFKTYKFVGDVQAARAYKKGLISGKRLERFFDKMLENKHIENLKIPYTAVCTDMMSGKLFDYNKGLASNAIRASISLPGIFSPVEKDDMLLIDGGIIDNMPIKSARNFGKEVVIAVDVLGDHNVENGKLNMIQVMSLALFLLQKQKQNRSSDNADYLVKMNLEGVSVISYDSKSIKKLIAQGRKYGEKHIEAIKKLLY